MLVFMALLGGLRGRMGGGAGFGLFVVVSFAATCALWWFTAWFLLLGQVRWRVLIPTGVVTGLAMLGYALAAQVWMPEVVTRNQDQFGFFGVALALVTWFSGAAICLLVGACVGPILAEDTGWIGALVRGPKPDFPVEGATPSLPAPTHALRLRNAFRPVDEVLPSPLAPTCSSAQPDQGQTRQTDFSANGRLDPIRTLRVVFGYRRAIWSARS